MTLMTPKWLKLQVVGGRPPGDTLARVTMTVTIDGLANVC